VRQLFERHAAPSPADASAARLEFFKSQLWPRLREAAPRGLLLFVPHYFDYVRLRNFLRAEGAEFAELCEYTPQKEVGAAGTSVLGVLELWAGLGVWAVAGALGLVRCGSGAAALTAAAAASGPSQVARGRSLFARGELRTLVLTERAHFYNRCGARAAGAQLARRWAAPAAATSAGAWQRPPRPARRAAAAPPSERCAPCPRPAPAFLRACLCRYKIRGTNEIVFYSLPEHGHYYCELLNLLEAGAHGTVTAMFSRWAGVGGCGRVGWRWCRPW
jgi:hypothetical protein